MTFRAFSIGFSAALLALACGSNDDNNNPDNTDPNVTPSVIPPVDVAPLPIPTPDPVAPVVRPVTPIVDANESPARKLAREAAENVLRATCGDCHGSQLTPDLASGRGMNYIDDTQKLVDNDKLVPLDPENSLVIKRMRDGSMPPTQSNKPKATRSDIDTVVQYIANPAFWPTYEPLDESCPDQLVDFDQLYDAVSRDLADAEDDDGLTYRYIALTNRVTAGVCDNQALDRDRNAVFKMMNALSIDANIQPPLPINDEETIYRIDLADYQWDRAIDVVDGGTTILGGPFTDVWEAIIANNPYAVPFVGDQADDAKADSGTQVPVMFADSMLDAALIGNLYYAIINVDVNNTLANFVAVDLNIDVVQTLEDEEQVRAGTTKSQISKQDRVLQRDDIDNGQRGFIWQSFDFLDDAQNDSIFESPFDFLAGGTEAIFTLPNGMFGYIIADENDAIVEDSDILLDNQQGNNRAITSVSCSSCHASGLITTTDEVREVAISNRINFELNADEVQQLQAIYVEPEEFSRIIDDDSASFYQAALNELDIPLNGIDPVSFVFLKFDADVGLNDAAGDLGVTPDDLDNNVNELDPSLGTLRGGSVDRDDFTAVYVDSLCKLNTALENTPDPVVCDAAEALLLAQ